jgi:hypothetical protein
MSQADARDDARTSDVVSNSTGVTENVRGGKYFPYFLAIAAAIAISSLVVAWASVRTGSIAAGVALLRGDSIFASVSQRPLVEKESGTGSFTASFTNMSDEVLRIVGYNNPCSCFSVISLPLELPPHESKSVEIKIIAARLQGDDIPVYFLSDCPSQQEVPLVLVVGKSNLSMEKR